MNYMDDNENIVVEKIEINNIPCIRQRPRNHKGSLPTIIFYHGWSSNKERQKFRGFILASLGYQVIIPDAIYHGSRNPIDHNNSYNMGKYFWEIILHNIGEADYIIKEAIEKYKADPDKIAVAGHSMGAFTAAGVFTHNEILKTSIILNGSFNWQMSNEIFAKNLPDSTIFPEEEKVNDLDPLNNLDKLVDRAILMLHGANDKLVNIGPQEIFYNEIKSQYKDGSNISLIKYNNLGHFVTTNMMEDMARWLKKYL